MKVYIDLLFILNIGLDFILLMSVSIFLKRNVSFKKIFSGSMIGALTIIFLFINVGTILLFIIKVLLAIIMCIITFGYHDLKYTFNNVFYLYIISIIIGGGLYLLKNYGYYNYFILVVGFIVISYLYIKNMKNYENNYTNYFKVDLYINGECYKLNGYLDTGNKLYDQYKKRPIILINKKIKYDEKNIIYVPYVTLNNESLVKCLKIDKIIINKKVFYNYLIGLSNKDFKIDGINCILHSKMKGYI